MTSLEGRVSKVLSHPVRTSGGSHARQADLQHQGCERRGGKMQRKDTFSDSIVMTSRDEKQPYRGISGRGGLLVRHGGASNLQQDQRYSCGRIQSQGNCASMPQTNFSYRDPGFVYNSWRSDVDNLHNHSASGHEVEARLRPCTADGRALSSALKNHISSTMSPGVSNQMTECTGVDTSHLSSSVHAPPRAPTSMPATMMGVRAAAKAPLSRGTDGGWWGSFLNEEEANITFDDVPTDDVFVTAL